jgi:ribosomal protein S18 acetylase RimI-like enzyme
MTRPVAPEIRYARPRDDLAPLLYESSPLSYDAYFGGPDRALRQLRSLTSRPGHDAAFDHCVVAQDAGELAGVLASYAAADYDALSRRSTLLTFGQNPPWRWPAMLRVHRNDVQLDPPEGSWYVDALAVIPGARRRGLASALMRDAERRAREAGCSELALDTAVGNAAARALYESLGMVAGTPVPAQERYGALGGAWIPYAKAL